MSAATPTITRLGPDAAATMDIGVFGQQAGMQIYTQLTYIFAVADDDAARPAVVATLRAGLVRLAAAFPWLAGQVVHEAGRYRFAPLEATPRLFVKDLTESNPELTFDALQEAGFPFRLLDESVVAPRRTLPGYPDEADLKDKPVLLVQAGFVRGGLLLTFVAHHATMDMAGQGEVIRWFAKACRGEALTEQELTIGNCERTQLVPLLGDDEGGRNPFPLIPEQALPPKSTEDVTAPTPQGPVSCAWSYFEFSDVSLAALKAGATATLPPDGGVPFVSTNDAYTAFLWKSIMRARAARLGPDRPFSTFARAIDVRRYMGVPDNYPGLLQNMTLHKNTVQWVCDTPLGEVAACLRAAIVPDRLRARTRALATCIARYPDEAATRITFVGHGDMAAGGLMLSSWAGVASATLDFGLGPGEPRSVRRPQFTPVESLLYLMPRAADGSIAAGLCLREADLARLRADPVFSKYGRYAG